MEDVSSFIVLGWSRKRQTSLQLLVLRHSALYVTTRNKQIANIDSAQASQFHFDTLLKRLRLK
jgi:hypothetical protein